VLVLKLVKSERLSPTLPTEAERLVELEREHPQIIHDTSVAFPTHIFGCFDSNCTRHHDLIVMPQAPGCSLADFIATKWHTHQVSEVMSCLGQLGHVLASFHARYKNKQHGDLQPSNIYYDEQAHAFTFLDVSDLGASCIHETDLEHFSRGLHILSKVHGEALYTDGKQRFETSYESSARDVNGA